MIFTLCLDSIQVALYTPLTEMEDSWPICPSWYRPILGPCHTRWKGCPGEHGSISTTLKITYIINAQNQCQYQIPYDRDVNGSYKNRETHFIKPNEQAERIDMDTQRNTHKFWYFKKRIRIFFKILKTHFSAKTEWLVNTIHWYHYSLLMSVRYTGWSLGEVLSYHPCSAQSYSQ